MGKDLILVTATVEGETSTNWVHRESALLAVGELVPDEQTKPLVVAAARELTLLKGHRLGAAGQAKRESLPTEEGGDHDRAKRCLCKLLWLLFLSLFLEFSQKEELCDDEALLPTILCLVGCGRLGAGEQRLPPTTRCPLGLASELAGIISGFKLRACGEPFEDHNLGDASAARDDPRDGGDGDERLVDVLLRRQLLADKWSTLNYLIIIIDRECEDSTES